VVAEVSGGKNLWTRSAFIRGVFGFLMFNSFYCAMLCVSAVLSAGVCPSVTLVYCIQTAADPSNFFINQSIKTHLYSAIKLCRKRIRGACWAGLGRVFTFAVRSVKQFSFQSTPEQNRTEQNFITTSKSTYGRLPE